FNFLVTDQAGATATATITITVEPINDPPTIVVTSTVFKVEQCEELELTVKANDVDEDTVGLSWSVINTPSGPSPSPPNYILTGSTSTTATFTGKNTGKYEVEVMGNDGNGGISTDKVEIEVTSS